jgi:hypothetical protein
MKKLTLFATALAAVFAASSCSSDDTLAELTPTPEVQGIPLTISVLNDNTRGEDITAISSYNMTAVYNTNAAWFKNIAFTKTNNVWGSDPAQTWSTSDAVTSAQFYAVSTNGNDAPEIGDDLTFSWTSPTTTADQKDLMIGRSVVVDGETKTPSAIDKGETVKLDFTHGLCKVEVIPYVLCYARTGAKSKCANPNGATGKVRKIVLHNISSKGSYSFVTGAWTASEVSGDLVDYTINFDPAIDIQSITKSAEENSLTVPTQDPLYIIPQTVTSWSTHITKTAAARKTFAQEPNSSYVEIECVVGLNQSLIDLDTYDAEDYEDADFEEDPQLSLGWTADDAIDDNEKIKRLAFMDYTGKYSYTEDNNNNDTPDWLEDWDVNWRIPVNSAKHYASYVDELEYQTVYLPLQSYTYTTEFVYTPVTFGAGKVMKLKLQLQNALNASNGNAFGNSVQVQTN